MSHLLDGFLASLARHLERPAVCDAGQMLSYGELALRARRIAAQLPRACSRPALGAVCGRRGSTAYASVLGTLWSGRAYVPIHPRFPPARNARVLERAEPDVLIVDRSGCESLPEMLASVARPLVVVLPDGPLGAELQRELRSRAAHHVTRVVDSTRGDPAAADPAPASDDLAYLLFTSGSTGEPKGVPIRHASVCDYLRSMADRHDLDASDRVSQVFDFTFDLSLHDLFVCWGAGACLFAVPDNALAAPASFIRKQRLTSWFCVPSLASRMARLKQLEPDGLGSLRISSFCGEALPVEVAERWQAAAPRSLIDNLYGPTEGTIAITAFRFDRDQAHGQPRNAVVPIGWALPAQRAEVFDERGRRVERGRGELRLSGSQVADGYWRDPTRSAERFLVPPNDEPGDGASHRAPDSAATSAWFKTGDHVERGADGCLHYLGRLDDQLKIRGYRVELSEIDEILRRITGTQDALAIPWPSREAAEGVWAAVCPESRADPETLRAECARWLPDHMVPRRVVVLQDMPRGSSGKLDRNRVLTWFIEKGLG